MHLTTSAPPRANRPVRAWLGATALAIALAACGGGAAAPAVPTAPPSSAGPGPQASAGAQISPSASLSPEDAILAYARCMRDHGIDMPDPQFVSGGGATGATGGAAIQISGDPASSAFKDASKACDPLMPTMGSSGSAPIPQEVIDQALKFSKCMRDHGIEMPDPQFSSGGASVSIDGTGAQLDPTSTKFQEAARACGMPAGGTVTVGGGPGSGVGGPSGAPAAQP